MSLRDRVLLMGYSRDMAREDKGFRILKGTLTDNNHIDVNADVVWRSATYVDSRPWVDADLRDMSLADKGSYGVILAMTPLTNAKLMAPTFWTRVASCLQPNGRFAAWIADIHVLDSYVSAKHQLVTVHRCAGAQSLSRMSLADQNIYAQALSDWIVDIIRWSGGLLISLSSETMMISDASRLSLSMLRSP